MNDPELLHITNPRAFLLHDFQSFMLKALSTSPLMPDAEAAILELATYLNTGGDLIGLFAVRERGLYTGMALAENNASALSPGCTVLHFYNAGSPEARKRLVQAVLAFAAAGGMSKIRGFDVNSKPRAFARLFQSDSGLVASPLGQIYEFEARGTDT